MKEGPRDPGGNSDQIFLPAENFYLPGPGKLRQVYAAPASDAGGRGLVGGYGGQHWKQFARVNEEIFDGIILGRILQLLECAGVCDFEFRCSGPAQ